jgi:hypothetical protein
MYAIVVVIAASTETAPASGQLSTAASQPPEPKIYTPCIGNAVSDYGMRCSTMKYCVRMSEDDAVCNAVAAAWNIAAPGPLLLYRNPPFLRWTPLTWSLNRKQFSRWNQADLTFAPRALVADIFNDGTPVLMLKYVDASGRNPPSDRIAIYSGSNVAADKWGDEDEISKKLRRSAPLTDAVKKNTEAQAYGYPKLSPEERAHEPWRDYDRGQLPEVNLISITGKIYVVTRETDHGVGAVILFDGNRRGNDVCYIEPVQEIS